MKKTAIVYDKWLSTLGGGEMVACNIAKVLLDLDYEVTFVAGKIVPTKLIKEKLGIDLSKAHFVEVWNDEYQLQQLSKAADIFVNTTFMDYSVGNAKKNFYYAYFPTTAGNNPLYRLKNKYLLPIISALFQPKEPLSINANQVVVNSNFGYRLQKQPLKIAFYNLKINKTYTLKFQLFLDDFSKTNLENILFDLDGAAIITKQIICDHHHNVLRFTIKIKANNNTVYGKWQQTNDAQSFLLNVALSRSKLNQLINDLSLGWVENRLRAGVFTSIPIRIKKYDHLLCDSLFAAHWINKYWGVSSQVLYPTVDLLFDKYKVDKYKKKNQICSVGRFFTLGHGKKQEEMITAFKHMCDTGLTDWELHLAGGVGSEPSSQAFVQFLQKQAHGYPIYFHFNYSRQEIEDLYLHSKIYWHATGLGENKNKNPIKMEHFGISPIEAMSAGCIPVLYNGGGLPETIYNLGADDRYLFNNLTELEHKTLQIIRNHDHEIFLTKDRQKKMEELYSLAGFRKQFSAMIKN